MTVAEDFAAFVVDLAWDEVSTAVADHVRDRVLDALSTAIASRNVATTRTALAAAAALSGGSGLSGGPGPCTVLPTGGTASLDHASLVNGTAVHAILFEDINLASADHPGAVIVPAALAAAEAAETLTGRGAEIVDLLRASWPVTRCTCGSAGSPATGSGLGACVPPPCSGRWVRRRQPRRSGG